ncbi:MAG: glycosyltransferase [Candidatus Eisenbacteria bacterium]
MSVALTVLQIVSHGVGDSSRRGVGGPEKRTLESLRRLDRSRFRPVIAYSREGALFDSFVSSGAPVVDLSIRGIEDVGAGRRLSAIIRDEAVDVVHSQGPLAYDFYGARAAVREGVPFVVTRPVVIADYTCSALKRAALSAVDRSTLRTAARVVAVSENGRGRLAALRGVDPGKVLLVRNGVDVERYRPDPGARARLLAETGDGSTDPEAPVVGMLAQLVDHKGWDDFLLVARELLAERPDALAFVVGGGPMLDELQAASREMGVAGSVRFLGLRSDVEKILPALDVVLLTSRREGLPVSLIEAMASGRPIVTTDAGGSAELVREGETGHVVPTGDWRAASACVRGIVNDRERMARMGAAARALAVAEFSLERMVAAYEDVYRVVVSSSPLAGGAR